MATDISSLFGLNELSEDERQEFLDEIGGVILESAVLNFLLTLDEAEHAQFQEFLSTAGEGESLLEALATTYPGFVAVLETEISKFREEAQSTLGNEAV